jgi:acetyl-CoA carboxylase/biotin carboxylase 1
MRVRLQLGGPRVMGANGVSHHIVEDDLAGVACALRWLAYTPARVGEPPLPLPTADPEGRAVEYAPGEGVSGRRRHAAHESPVPLISLRR